jgi:hypothetical protein
VIQHLLRPHHVEEIALADRTARCIGRPFTSEGRNLPHRRFEAVQLAGGKAGPAAVLRNANCRILADQSLVEQKLGPALHLGIEGDARHAHAVALQLFRIADDDCKHPETPTLLVERRVH